MDTIVKLWVFGQIALYVIGTISSMFYMFIVVPHMLSGGYWPKWYRNWKIRREKSDEDKNPITLKLN
jgi:hypothetical protein